MNAPTPTPWPPEYFDYREDAAIAGITGEQLRLIQHHFERDYPADVMLRELHILRACRAVRGGLVGIDAFRQGGSASAA